MAEVNKQPSSNMIVNGQFVNGVVSGGGGVFIKSDQNPTHFNHHHLNLWNNSIQFDHDSLIRLETLINEFFLPITSNERKRQIEVILAEFSNTPNSWQMSFLYFERTINEYTRMFCLTVIEQFINQRWHTLPADVRTSFRTSLWKHLFENHAQITPPIRNKFCKILVTIARYDWPYHYPDFMSNILELLTPDPGQNILHSATLILLGLNLLGTTVEELTSNQYHNHFSSKIELIAMLQSNLPNMLQALTLLLESIISKHINYYSATPPPSPTSIHNNNNSNNSSGNSPPNILSNITKTNDTLGNVFQMSLKKGLLHSIPEMDHEFVHLTSQIFVCLSQIIDFMPVSYYKSINSTLLSALYVLATFGSINPSYNSSKLGLISMQCINELMSKASTFNSEANEFILNVFQNTFLILQLIVTSSLTTPHNGETRLDEIDEDYLKKFIDFLKLFISNHLGRFEKFISFHTKDFLQLLFEFTTKMCHLSECYLMLLDTWSVYFDYLENFINSKHKEKHSMNEKLESIKEPIFSFLLFVLRSIQYSCNGDYLKHLDNENYDNDYGRTELENYLFHSIEIVSKIAEIYSEEAINLIDNYYNEKLQNIYYGLEFLVNNNDKSLMNNSASNEKLYSSTNDLCQQVKLPIEELQLRIMDFITMLQVFSRFSNFFVDLQFEKYFVRTKMIFDKLCEILHFIEVHKFDDLYRSCSNPLLSEFLLLKAQIIATFKAYIVWFQQVCCNVGDHNKSSSQLEMNRAIEHITIIINTCCTIICDIVNNGANVPAAAGTVAAVPAKPIGSQNKMFHSAALTLNTFSSNIRSQFVFTLNSVQRLFDQNFQTNLLNLNCQRQASIIAKDKDHLPSLTDQILISQSISNLLILPWFQISNDSQNWDRRSIYLNMFIGEFLHLFNELDLNDPNQIVQDKSEDGQKCPNVYCRSLYILKQVIKSHSDSPLKSKQLLLQSLNSSLEAFILLLMHNQLLHSTVVGCQITRHILALFIVVFKVLLARIHMDFVERTIQTLLQIINRHDVMSSTQHNSTASHTNAHKSTQHHNQQSQIREITGLGVIIKFLKLLILVIGQTSLNSFLRSILPDIINFAVMHVQNNIVSVKCTMGLYFRNTTGIQYDTYHKLLRVYYRFLYELLLNNCRYFFTQRLITNNQQQSNQSSAILVPSNNQTNIIDNGNKSSIEHHQQQRQFELIMEIFGESFMQPENIQLFRQNVEALEQLNYKLKLYERTSFREKFWERFLYLFMQTLLDHSLDLLNESLFTIIYHLAQVDFLSFYESFMAKYISNLSRLNEAQRLELINNFKMDLTTGNNGQLPIDLPSFSSKLNQLLCDVRFFYKCNT